MIADFVEKKWGGEIIFANNNDYCGKILQFAKKGNKCSMHFHMEKHETWYVGNGSLKVTWINTVDGSEHEAVIKAGDVWVNEPGVPHRLEALEDNSFVFEVSTPHKDSDSYRVAPGDNQA